MKKINLAVAALSILVSCTCTNHHGIIPESATLLNAENGYEIWYDADGLDRYYVNDKQKDSVYLLLCVCPDTSSMVKIESSAVTVPICHIHDVNKIEKVPTVSDSLARWYIETRNDDDILSYLYTESCDSALLFPTNNGLIGFSKEENLLILESVEKYKKGDGTYSTIFAFDQNGKLINETKVNAHPDYTAEEELALFHFSDINSRAFGYKNYQLGIVNIPYREAHLYSNNIEKASLILFLHGLDGRGTDNELQIKYDLVRNLYKQLALNEHKAIIIAPQITQLWHQYTSEIKSLLDNICIVNNVDPNRIYVCGYSMGGLGTWSMVLSYPGYFAAAMPIAAGCPISTRDQYRQVTQTAICYSNGRQEPDDTNKMNTLRQCGGKVYYHYHPEWNHGQACGYGFSEKNLKWFLRQVKQ